MYKQNLQLNNKTILITGAAGFIGSNLVMSLLKANMSIHVIGLDNCNDYYDVSLKDYRLSEIDKLAALQTENRWTYRVQYYWVL